MLVKRVIRVRIRVRVRVRVRVRDAGEEGDKDAHDQRMSCPRLPHSLGGILVSVATFGTRRDRRRCTLGRNTHRSRRGCSCTR